MSATPDSKRYFYTKEKLWTSWPKINNLVSTEIFTQGLNTASIWNQTHTGQWEPLKVYIFVSILKFCEYHYRELLFWSLNGIENCRVKRTVGGFCFSVFSSLLLYETELILTKIITFRNYLSIHNGLISLNYECRGMRNTTIEDCISTWCTLMMIACNRQLQKEDTINKSIDVCNENTVYMCKYIISVSSYLRA